MSLKHNLKTLDKAMSADYKTHGIEYYTLAHEELLNLIEELEQLKQEWEDSQFGIYDNFCEFIDEILGKTT